MHRSTRVVLSTLAFLSAFVAVYGEDKQDPKIEPPKKAISVKKPARRPVPAGAKALGYTKCIVDERPVAEDISKERIGDHKWFSGQWYNDKPPSFDHYSTVKGTLALTLGGDLVSAARDMSPGHLPYLPGADGFYVEFDVRLSDDDPDHFPAV